MSVAVAEWVFLPALLPELENGCATKPPRLYSIFNATKGVQSPKQTVVHRFKTCTAL